MTTTRELPLSDLYRECNPAELGFETTQEIEELRRLVSQDRACDAIRLGASIAQQGYNLFVLGSEGSGRLEHVKQYVSERALREAPGSDLCYLNNFDALRQPRAIELPAGSGREFAADMERLVDDARGAIPAAFETDDYRTRREAIETEVQEEQEAALREVTKRAKDRGIGILQTPTGIAFAPIRGDETLGPDEFSKLPKEEQEQVVRDTEATGKELQAVMQQRPKRVREARRRIRELDREVALWCVGSLLEELTQKYASHEPVVQHLQDVREDIVENVALFRPAAEDSNPFRQLFGDRTTEEPSQSAAIHRYGVNVVVDRAGDAGAPVVHEQNPTFQRLLGCVEHVSQMGTLVTNFQLIKAGALHRANGGYLLLDARKLLAQPFAYDGLKRVLQSGELRIESLGQAYSLISTLSLEPDPVSISVKVVLIGDRWLYYALQAFDPEFCTLFKVAADFSDEVDRSPDNTRLYARVLGTLARRNGLRPLDAPAVARVIEEAARESGDGEKLTARLRPMADIMREADFHAAEAERDVIDVAAVEDAIAGRTRRSGRLRDHVQEAILRNTILIDTQGQVVGQVNGLAVLEIGGRLFGRPNRITARVALGSGKVIDIEREVELGGPIHSKGVMILASYVGSTYSADEPFSLRASLVFEQSYGGVEGDSASCAELCALLSALADVPIAQSVAITGSVNQRGEVQAIGGVNHKIEGFFEICEARGLTGSQGVVIPRSNVKHLMLRSNVRSAVEQGLFHIYAVEKVDDAMELLTRLRAGEIRPDGSFPTGSINERVRMRLLGLAEKRRELGTARERVSER
jgi:lon-related putative ATP-dependent protease